MIVNYNDTNKIENLNTIPYNGGSSKYFNKVNGNALLTKPAYQTANNTWVAEYIYKDSEMDVLIKQKVKVSSHNQKIATHYIHNEIIERDRFKINEDGSENLADDFPFEPLEKENVRSEIKKVKSYMLENPLEVIKAQASQRRENVLALISQ